MPPEANNLEQTLVAATLVAASLAVLFMVWQADVAAALSLKKSDTGQGNEDDEAARDTVRTVLFCRSAPLLATAGFTFYVLVHQLWPTLSEAWRCVGAGCSLDDVKALAVINGIVVGLLTLGLLGQFRQLWNKWRSLGGLPWLPRWGKTAQTAASADEYEPG